MAGESNAYHRFKEVTPFSESLKTSAEWLTGKIESKHFDEYESSIPYQLLRHCSDQALRAAQVGDIRGEWQHLQKLLSNASDVWCKHNTYRTCEAFFLLGQICGQLSMPAREEILEGKHALIEKRKKEFPLIKRNIAAECCRKAVQRVAQIEWENDRKNAIRLSEMCEIIWAKLAVSPLDSDFLDALPDRAAGLKPWLRTVAPEYARKGGAPRKK